MATDAHTPFNRGYDKFLGYFHHSNDYWSHAEQKCYLKEVRRAVKSRSTGQQH